MTDATGAEALRAADRAEKSVDRLRADIQRLEDRTTPLATFKAHETTSDREFAAVKRAVAEVKDTLEALRESLTKWREETAQADLEAARREAVALEDANKHREQERTLRRRFILTVALGLPATMLAAVTLAAFIMTSLSNP